MEHIDDRTGGPGGFYKIKDTPTDEYLELIFVRIHDAIVEVDNGEYFACTDFKSKDGRTYYDIDLTVRPKDGGMAVTDVKIHKIFDLAHQRNNMKK